MAINTATLTPDINLKAASLNLSRKLMLGGGEFRDKTSTITANSKDFQIPSALAVKNYLASQFTAGSLNIGSASAANASALVEFTSTTKGILLPRMTTTQRDAIATPAAGLLIYNTTTGKLNFRAASAWEAVTSA